VNLSKKNKTLTTKSLILKNRKFQSENQEAPGLNLRLVGLVAADFDLDRKTLTTKGKKIQKRLMKILGTMAKKTMKTSVFTMSPTSTKWAKRRTNLLKRKICRMRMTRSKI
jgi:hypothetical protein